MPELPEVETTRRGIAPHLVGRTISAVDVREPRLRWPVDAALGQLATGVVLTGVGRRGKYLLLESARGTVMIHLGMSGSLRVIAATVPAERHDHVDFVLDNGQMLRFRDPRRFGSIFWLSDGQHPLLADLGPEPLGEAFDDDYLWRASRGRKVAVKQFLMNANVVVGVGNIYANEALFQAGINPLRQAGRVSQHRYQQLSHAVRAVLAAAIEAGGTTLRDFVREDGKPGYFRNELLVYGRGGEPCSRCQRPLREVRMSDRTTVYCVHCQR